MVDMTFLLLIFFLVAGKWRPAEDFLPLALPTAAAQTPTYGNPEPLTISIYPDQAGCTVHIGPNCEVKIRQADLENTLADFVLQMNSAVEKQKRFTSDPVQIVCDPGVRWQHLARIYNLLYGMGLTDITFQMTRFAADEPAD
jgi:biopolymer transport protein ExbD